MPSITFSRLVASLAGLYGLCSGQQYAGDTINNTLPAVSGAELAFFRTSNGGTLLNYYSHDTNNNRLNDANIVRAVVVIHGSLLDGWNYESDMLKALGSGAGGANKNNVAIMAPVFANEGSVGKAYQAGDSALAWGNYSWFYGANTIHPTNSPSISSFSVFDEIVQYFDNKAQFPNLKTIVLAGHSRGAQMVDRYAKISTFGHSTQVIHYVGNPNGYLWLSTTRPESTSSCPTYNNYPDGLSNFQGVGMTYNTALVAQGATAVLNNYNSKIIAYAKGLNDTGDASDTCGPYTQGSNRLTRFQNWIRADPPTCSNPATGPCQTVDYVNTTHNDLAMFASSAGRARLFTDNLLGDGSRSRDLGYPRLQPGDDPYPSQSQKLKRAHEWTA